MARREFIDPWRAVRGGHVMDLDWLWDAIEREDPLDRRAAAASSVEYGLIATCVRSGEPHCLVPGADDMLDALKASCALPILYRKTIEYRGERYVDGGLSDPIPVREAYRRGARTILVLRSRAAHFVKKARLSNRFGAWALRRDPGLVKACQNAANVYCDAVAFMQNPPEGCRVIQVAPAGPLATRRTSRDRSALERDYALGRALGRDAIERFERGKPALGLVG
jgi:predicted patatin/cPLA2 family phospholipase